MEKIIYQITEIDANQRIDKYLKKQLPKAPTSFIFRLFRLKDVRVDNVRVPQEYIIKNGDEITIFLTTEQKNDFIVAYEFTLVRLSSEVIFENEDILVVNKLRGLLVHSDINEQEFTLANQVLTYLHSKGEFDASKRGYIPSPVGRIDKNTSGIVIFAKKQEINQLLAKAFHDNSVDRTYLALVHGQTDNRGKIRLALTKNVYNKGLVEVDERGKEGVTNFKLLRAYENFSLLEVKLETGRSNQIRVHFAHIAHPIVGDHKYGIEDDFRTLCLHHHKVKFANMEGPALYLNDLEFVADLPEDIQNILNSLEE
ncbi:MAG TPA: RluA family pseudouridine synthase [Bacilli bacterium]|nr:RluA family pseudouridine synthase [Bacilli bacterium]